MTENHDALREWTGLYVLGALDADDRQAFEAHLATCAECSAEVRTLAGVSTALPYAVPQTEPPPALRARILRDAGAASAMVATPGARRTGFLDSGWLSAAAMLLVALGLGSYAASLRSRVSGLELQLQVAVSRLDRSEREVQTATRLAESAQLRMAVLTSPDLTQVNLAGQPPAPRARGRAFWSRSTGLVFAATELPQLPPGRTYQLWFLRGPASPVSAGLLKPDDVGRVALAFDTPPGVTTSSGLAVSIEPDGGVLAPTGDLYLVGSTQ
jgi:anti-sigma-K factor RskA